MKSKALKKIDTCLPVFLCAFLLNGCSVDSSKSSTAIHEILHQLDSYPLVAIGESHGWKEESEFIFELIKDPSFSKQVNDVVVECGNSSYQSLMDDYVNGKEVPLTALQNVWRNMTVLCTCDAPIYEQLFQTVREANQKLDTKNRIRVLLGEPPIDWKKINKSEDLGSWIFQRDEYYARVVEKEVLQKNRKALLIMGSLHFIKKGWGEEPAMSDAPMSFNNSNTDNDTGKFTMKIAGTPQIDSEKQGATKVEEVNNNAPANIYALNVCQILQQKYPGKLFTILPYDGYGDAAVNKEIEKNFSHSEKPLVITTQNNWIGKLDAGKLYSRKSLALTNGKVTGEVNYNPYPNLKISDLCDAYLYISSSQNMTRSIPAAILTDTAYLNELNRRSLIISSKPFHLDDYTETSLNLHK